MFKFFVHTNVFVLLCLIVFVFCQILALGVSTGVTQTLAYSDSSSSQDNTLSRLALESPRSANQNSNIMLTKDTSIQVEYSNERLSDTLFTLKNPKNELQDISGQGKEWKNSCPDTAPCKNLDGSTRIVQTPFSGSNQESFRLGSARRDDTDSLSCTRISNNPSKHKRVGICNDGVYTIGINAADSAGNLGDWVYERIERDTVKPDKPEIQLSKNGRISGESLSFSLTGEAGSLAVVQISASNKEQVNIQLTIDKSGVISNENILAKYLTCGGVKYKSKAYIIDSAQNVSDVATSNTVISSECPRCMGGEKAGWTNPIHNVHATITSGFQTKSRPDHMGDDINVGQGIFGEPVYAAKAGIVSRVWFEEGGYGNVVYINNGGGYETRYGHMLEVPIVSVGQHVTMSTQLGKLGSTGNSTGPHLHFEIRKNGVALDPGTFINMVGSNLQSDEYAQLCQQSENGSGLEKNWDDSELNDLGPVELTVHLDVYGHIVSQILKPRPVVMNLSYTNKSGQEEVTAYGLGIYKRAPIKIKIVEEYRTNVLCAPVRLDCTFDLFRKDSEVEALVEHTQIQLRKYNQSNQNLTPIREFWNDTNQQYGYKDDLGNSLKKGRWITNASLPGNSTPMRIGQFADINYDDLLCPLTKIFGSVGYTNFRGKQATLNLDGIESDEGGCKQIKKQGTSVTDPFYVGANWVVDEDMIRKGVDANTRKITFELASANKWNDLGGSIVDQYDNVSQVWIVSHGWYNNPNSSDFDTNYMESNYSADDNRTYRLAQTIAQNRPNDVVLLLDWREASGYGNGMPQNVGGASPWIVPVAQRAAQKLRDWGLKDGTKLNFVGHSLGTLLSREIANQFGGANQAVLLDPPSQLSMINTNFLVNYDLDGNLPGIQSVSSTDSSGYFKNKFKFSRSFVGSRSIAADKGLSNTAHESIEMSFASGFVMPGDEHFQVVKTFDRMNRDTHLVNNYLDINHMYRQTSEFGENSVGTNHNFEGSLMVASQNGGRNSVQFARTILGGVGQYYGTVGDDKLSIFDYEGEVGQKEMRYTGGGGSDYFDGMILSTNTYQDFNDGGDRIGLPKCFGLRLVEQEKVKKVRCPFNNSDTYIQGDRANEITAQAIKNEDPTVLKLR